MKNILLSAVVALAALTSSSAQVAERTFDLADPPYSLTPYDRASTVADKFTAGKDTVVLNTAWRVAKGPLYGLTYQQWKTVNYFSACFVDAAWHGEDAERISKHLNTFNRIFIPSGRYLSNIQLTIPRGGVSGAGSFGYYVGNGSQFVGTVSTEIEMNDAKWIDTDNEWHERILFTTPNWGLETGDMGYNESILIERIRLTGPSATDKIVRIGLALGRPGENSKVDQVYSNDFSYGFVARGSVPLTMVTCSAFNNRVAGFAGRGTAATTMNLLTFSGDDNGIALTMLEPGYGNPSGGVLNVTLGKDEAHGSGQLVGYYMGQFAVVVNLCNASGTLSGGNTLFAVDGRIGAPFNHGMQNSSLHVVGMTFGFDNVLVDLAAHTRYPVPYGFSNISPASFDFRYYTKLARFSSTIADLMPVQQYGCDGLLGAIPINPNTGALTTPWDYTKCLPAHGATTSVPMPADPCVWLPGTWSDWSACSAGSQYRTRTVTSTGNCSGTASPATVDTRSCEVVPPPTGEAPKWTATASTTKDVAYLSDGNVATRWTSGAPQSGNEYIAATLDVISSVSSVTMDGGDRWYDCAVAYSVDVTTGANWVTVASGAGNPNSREPIVVNFAPVNAKSVRVRQTGTSKTNWWTVAELGITITKATPTIPVEPPKSQLRIIKGVNCANAERFVVAQGFQQAVDALKVKLMRFPGGTVANSWHGAGLSEMVALAKASKVDVIFVANLLDGTPDEVIAALNAFAADGVRVVGLELGNEYYLSKYQSVFPDANAYVAKCNVFIASIRAKYPSMPVGIVATPSALMKDPDSQGTASKRLAEWNPVVLSSGIADAVIVHAYTTKENAPTYLGNALDHFTYVSSMTKLPVWVTEYNMLGAEQSKEQVAFIGSMLSMMNNAPVVQFACLHNLVASGDNNNAITITGSAKKPVAKLTAIGASLGTE